MQRMRSFVFSRSRGSLESSKQGRSTMADQQPTRPQRARSKRDDKQQAGRGTSQNGDGNAATYEQELALYLQERIKSDLNRGAIPLLARSIAKELAHRRLGEAADLPGGPSREEDDVGDDMDDDDVRGGADDDFSDEVDDDFSDEHDDDVRGEADDDFDDDDVRGEADDDFDEDDVHAEADNDFDDDEDEDDDVH